MSVIKPCTSWLLQFVLLYWQNGKKANPCAHNVHRKLLPCRYSVYIHRHGARPCICWAQTVKSRVSYFIFTFFLSEPPSAVILQGSCSICRATAADAAASPDGSQHSWWSDCLWEFCVNPEDDDAFLLTATIPGSKQLFSWSVVLCAARIQTHSCKFLHNILTSSEMGPW